MSSLKKRIFGQGRGHDLDLCIRISFGAAMMLCSGLSAESLSEFLHLAKEKQRTLDKGTEVHYVMGNEAADADSIVSSIAYAYYLHRQYPEELFIPLLNIQREELGLRKEMLFLFDLLKISSEDLLFLDDGAFNQPATKGTIRLNLVDHNKLKPSQDYLSTTVERIVDHHADEKVAYPFIASPEDKLIAPVGSATTLVAEKWLENESRQEMNSELATLLLAPILLDTINLQSPEKTTARDRQAVSMLLPYFSSLTPQAFFDELTKRKNDATGLTPVLLISKDFKEYLDGDPAGDALLYGISSLPVSLHWWTQDEEMLLPLLDKFCRDRNFALLFLLIANPDPTGPKRQLIAYSPSAKFLSSLNSYMQEDKKLSDLFVLRALSSNGKMSYFTAEPFVSRKQLQPLFHFSNDAALMSTLKEEFPSLQTGN